MFEKIELKKIGILTLVLFGWFCILPSFAFPQEEDALVKARRLYEQGYYDDAITLLNDYINKIKTVAEQKKNVARAFYQLAKVFFTVGEDEKVEENLKKVFEAYPTFQESESNLEFKELAEKLRSEISETTKAEAEVEKEKTPKVTEEKTEVIIQPKIQAEVEKQPVEERKVIEHPSQKKKKKFPVLLVIGGLVVAGALVYFLLLNKKKESKITDVTVKIDIQFSATNLGCQHIIRINGVEKLNEFMAFNVPGSDDFDDAKKINRTIYHTLAPGVMTIEHEVKPAYIDYYPAQETWIWATEFKLAVSSYNYEGDNPGPPYLSESAFNTTVAPWHTNPADTWYRIESHSVSVIAPITGAVYSGNVKSGKKVFDIRNIKTKK
jgi:tetratricopeptide (TPR) repeat protein